MSVETVTHYVEHAHTDLHGLYVHSLGVAGKAPTVVVGVQSYPHGHDGFTAGLTIEEAVMLRDLLDAAVKASVVLEYGDAVD